MKAATNHIGEFLTKLLKPILALLLTGIFLPSALAVSYPTSAWNFDLPSDRGKDLVDSRPLDIIGLPVTSFGPGLFGDAIIYDGNALHRAQRPVSDTVFDLGSSDFTMQVWYKPNDLGSEQVLLEKFNGASGPGWTFYKNSAHGLEFYGQGTLGGVFLGSAG